MTDLVFRAEAELKQARADSIVRYVKDRITRVENINRQIDRLRAEELEEQTLIGKIEKGDYSEFDKQSSLNGVVVNYTGSIDCTGSFATRRITNY